MRKNDAFDAKIVNTRLTKIFIAIFAPDEREAGEDTGTYFREITDLEFQNHKNVKKMYFPHTRTSWDKFMFNGMPNSNFKIGLSLFGCAEKYTEQSTHYAV